MGKGRKSPGVPPGLALIRENTDKRSAVRQLLNLATDLAGNDPHLAQNFLMEAFMVQARACLESVQIKIKPMKVKPVGKK